MINQLRMLRREDIVPQSQIQLTQLWPIARRAEETLIHQYEPVLHQIGKQYGLHTQQTENLLFILSNFDVAPITPHLLWSRMPYMAQQGYANLLCDLKQAKLLNEWQADTYQLTDKARQIGWELFQAKHAYLGDLNTHHRGQLEHLATTLHRIVHHSRVSPTPQNKRWLISRCAYIASHAPALARITEYLADLNAFRDDCYLASWQQYGVEGYAWEAFSLLWRQGLMTLDKIAEQLNVRGYAPIDYAQALTELVQRGWVAIDKGVQQTAPYTYYLTPEGQQVRQNVEKLTDEQFYAAWHKYDQHELEHLANQLYEIGQKQEAIQWQS